MQKVGIFFCEFTYLSATENKYLIFVTKFALFLHIYFSSLKILATHASLIFSQLVDNQPLFTYADFFIFFLFETTLVYNVSTLSSPPFKPGHYLQSWQAWPLFTKLVNLFIICKAGNFGHYSKSC